MNTALPECKRFTWRRFVRHTITVVAFNTAIAVFLTMLGDSPFGVYLVFSQAIGLSIFALAHLFSRVVPAGRSIVAAQALAIPLGTVVGLVLGCWINGIPLTALVAGQPRILITTLPAALVFGTVISYYFYSRSVLAETRAVLREQELQRLANVQHATETSLKLLQAQIEPHFLFNTLANVLGLIDRQPDDAKRMLENFIHYLRASLQRSRAGGTTLRDELDLLQSYLGIQRIRMGPRLRFEFDVPADLQAAALPPLLLQPLVENAVRHGLEPTLAGGTVRVTARRETESLVLEVTDSGRGLPPQGLAGGVGLSNVRARLQALYGEHGRLQILHHRPTGVRIRLSLPYTAAAGTVAA
jgi:signal transduction histidine kinase